MKGSGAYRMAGTALLLFISGIDGVHAQRVHTVTMEGLAFNPPSLTAAPGDAIVWINKDPFPHTVTSESGGFDSGEIGPGKSWRYTARRVGSFHYRCKLHPTMKGALQVGKP